MVQFLHITCMYPLIHVRSLIDYLYYLTGCKCWINSWVKCCLTVLFRKQWPGKCLQMFSTDTAFPLNIFGVQLFESSVAEPADVKGWLCTQRPLLQPGGWGLMTQRDWRAELGMLHEIKHHERKWAQVLCRPRMAATELQLVHDNAMDWDWACVLLPSSKLGAVVDSGHKNSELLI